eukprot:5359890-Amphidinium_carterae.1
MATTIWCHIFFGGLFALAALLGVPSLSCSCQALLRAERRVSLALSSSRCVDLGVLPLVVWVVLLV